MLWGAVVTLFQEGFDGCPQYVGKTSVPRTRLRSQAPAQEPKNDSCVCTDTIANLYASRPALRGRVLVPIPEEGPTVDDFLSAFVDRLSHTRRFHEPQDSRSAPSTNTTKPVPELTSLEMHVGAMGRLDDTLGVLLEIPVETHAQRRSALHLPSDVNEQNVVHLAVTYLMKTVPVDRRFRGSRGKSTPATMFAASATQQQQEDGDTAATGALLTASGTEVVAAPNHGEERAPEAPLLLANLRPFVDAADISVRAYNFADGRVERKSLRRSTLAKLLWPDGRPRLVGDVRSELLLKYRAAVGTGRDGSAENDTPLVVGRVVNERFDASVMDCERLADIACFGPWYVETLGVPELRRLGDIGPIRLDGAPMRGSGERKERASADSEENALRARSSTDARGPNRSSASTDPFPGENTRSRASSLGQLDDPQQARRRREQPSSGLSVVRAHTKDGFEEARGDSGGGGGDGDDGAWCTAAASSIELIGGPSVVLLSGSMNHTQEGSMITASTSLHTSMAAQEDPTGVDLSQVLLDDVVEESVGTDRRCRHQQRQLRAHGDRHRAGRVAERGFSALVSEERGNVDFREDFDGGYICWGDVSETQQLAETTPSTHDHMEGNSDDTTERGESFSPGDVNDGLPIKRVPALRASRASRYPAAVTNRIVRQRLESGKGARHGSSSVTSVLSAQAGKAVPTGGAGQHGEDNDETDELGEDDDDDDEESTGFPESAFCRASQLQSARQAFELGQREDDDDM